jgi:hypothetical protein
MKAVYDDPALDYSQSDKFVYEKTWTRNKDVDEMMRERGEGGYDDASLSEEEALFE